MDEEVNFRSDLSGDWVRIEVLKKYGSHIYDCAYLQDNAWECTCGWFEIADNLAPIEEAVLEVRKIYEPTDFNPGGDGWPRNLDPISGKDITK